MKIIKGLKLYFRNKALAKAQNKLVDSVIAMLRSGITRSGGVVLPLEQTYFMDFAGEYRSVYKVGSYVIDTYCAAQGELISVARLSDGASLKGFISDDAIDVTIAFTDHYTKRRHNSDVMDLVYRADLIRDFADTLLDGLRHGRENGHGSTLEELDVVTPLGRLKVLR